MVRFPRQSCYRNAAQEPLNIRYAPCKESTGGNATMPSRQTPFCNDFPFTSVRRTAESEPGELRSATRHRKKALHIVLRDRPVADKPQAFVRADARRSDHARTNQPLAHPGRQTDE